MLGRNTPDTMDTPDTPSFNLKISMEELIYLIEYMLINYFSHFFCTRIVILLTSVRGKRTEVKIRHPG